MVKGSHGSYPGAQTRQHFEIYVRTCSLRNVSEYSTCGISKLVYTTACLPRAPRHGKVGAGVRLHGLGL